MKKSSVLSMVQGGKKPSRRTPAVSSGAAAKQQQQAPSLEWSSDSSDDSFTEETGQPQVSPRKTELQLHRLQPRNLIDMVAQEDEPMDALPGPDTAALLRTVAAVHLNERGGRHDTKVCQAQTSISSPGRRVSLRERMQNRSRLQRRVQMKRFGERVDKSRGVAEDDSLAQEAQAYWIQTAASLPASRRNDRVNVVPSSQSTTVHVKPPVNRILLHVYDLIETDTLMMIPPFGCIVEIGKCFANVNTALHAVGTGAYHVGVEINGVEYAYGATSVPNQTGVFTCFPRLSPGYQYRTTVDLGSRPLVRRSWLAAPSQDETGATVFREASEYVEGRTLMKEMAREYMGSDYDILRKNCCTFARDACLRLGVPENEIPTWFCNLAESGAFTQDAVRATVEPLSSVLSLACEKSSSGCLESTGVDQEAIETIFQASNRGRVVVVDDENLHRDLRRNSTWAF